MFFQNLNEWINHYTFDIIFNFIFLQNSQCWFLLCLLVCTWKMRENPNSYHCKIASCRAEKWGEDWAPSLLPSGSKGPSRSSENHPQHRFPPLPPAAAQVAPATSTTSTFLPSDSAASRPTPCIRVTAHPHPTRQHRTPSWKAGKFEATKEVWRRRL